MPPFIAIGANADLPADRDHILEQPAVFGYQALDQPVLLFRHPLCAAGHKERAGPLVRGRDADQNQRPRVRSDWGALDPQFDSGMADGAVVAEALSNAHARVTVALCEPFRAVLRWAIGFGNTKGCEVDFGCFHSLESAGVSCEA